MRILVFLPFFTYGGAEKQAITLASNLRSGGHAVDAWAFATPNNEHLTKLELEQKGIRCHELPPPPLIEWHNSNISFEYIKFKTLNKLFRWHFALSTLSRQAPKTTYDIIIPFTFLPSFAACVLKQKLGAHTIIWNHRGGYDDAGVDYSPFLVQYILDKKPKFVANSTAGQEFLKDKFKIAPEEVKIINNFLPSFPQAIRTTNNSKTKTTCNLVQISNYFPEKDFSTLISALKLLQNSQIKYHLHIIGNFPIDHLKAHFYELVDKDNLSEQITHHGSLPPNEVHKLLLNSDIAILSSRSEGCPNSVMEYMLSRLPVIGSDIAGIRALIGKPGADFLFEVGNSYQLAEKIEKLANSPQLCIDQGNSNLDRILEFSDPEKIMSEWLEMISP